MISLLPFHKETLVVPIEWPQVLNRLSTATTIGPYVSDDKILFFGWVKEDRFKLSLKIKKANSFIPLVSGSIDPTANGCLLFLTYRLFPVTRMFLMFWSLFIILGGIFIAFQYKKLFVLIYAGAIVVLILWIAYANFHLQLKITRQAIIKTLE